MTKAEFKANYNPIAMPQPFAHGGTLTEIGLTQDNNSVNFVDGFPQVYSAPKSNNGKFVTRGEINAIGNLASHNNFYHRCGGLNTFDPAFASAVGGYPEGAILQLMSNNALRYVKSLVDNNLVNFLEAGVDGVNWIYCYESTYQEQEEAFLAHVETAELGCNTSSSSNIYAKQSPMSGLVTIRNVKYSLGTESVVEIGISYAFSGVGLIARKYSEADVSTYTYYEPDTAPSDGGRVVFVSRSGTATYSNTGDSASYPGISSVLAFPWSSSNGAHFTIPNGLIAVNKGDFIFIDIINGFIKGTVGITSSSLGSKYIINTAFGAPISISFDIYII